MKKLVRRIIIPIFAVTAAGCSSEPQPKASTARTDWVAPPVPPPCDNLRQRHARSDSGTVFASWIRTNWPSGRFDDCLTDPPAQTWTVPQQRYCYGIAITYGHMSESPAKRDDRRAWFDMDCVTFLGRGLPSGPLPPSEDSAYTAAITALSR